MTSPDSQKQDAWKYEPDAKGGFKRLESSFRNFISSDPTSEFPAETGRYALYLSPACPWSHRTMIARSIKHLQGIIDLYICSFAMGSEGWYFSDDPAHVSQGSLATDPLYGFKTIKQLYLKADPSYTGRCTVPVLWDKKSHTLVNNESSEIIRMMYTEFDHLLLGSQREVNKPRGGLYPPDLRHEIDELNAWIYHTVNNGVYKSGFAFTQESYEEHVTTLFDSIARLETLLGDGRPFLTGDTVTDADIRLFPTIARFDIAYGPVFLCNLGMIRNDFPNLHLWMRRLYWDQSDKTDGAFYETTQPYIHHYKTGYAQARPRVLGITGPVIIPKGPLVMVHELQNHEKL